jgi:hypothetical protein
VPLEFLWFIIDVLLKRVPDDHGIPSKESQERVFRLSGPIKLEELEIVLGLLNPAEGPSAKQGMSPQYSSLEVGFPRVNFHPAAWFQAFFISPKNAECKCYVVVF